MRPVFWIVAAFLAAWGLALLGPFHFDDHSMLRDPAITGPDGWWQVWLPLRTRPLTQFSFWVNYYFAGPNPLPFHLVDLALHALNTILVWRLSRMLVPSGAAFITLAFAVHPIQSEPVNYVFARSTLLMTFFCLRSLWFWLREEFGLAILCFAFALLSKEECVTFPLVLLLLDAYRGKLQRSSWTTAGAMLALAFAAGIRAVIATSANPGAGAGFAAGITPVDYLRAQGPVIWRYLRLLIVPYGFTVDTQVDASPALWLSVAAWAAIVAVCVVAYRQRWYWLLAAFLLLVPSSSIFPAEDLAADRRLYLPLFAFACFASRWVDPRVPAVWVVLSFVRTSQVWSSEYALWAEAVERSPGKVRAHIQLARASSSPEEATQVLAKAATLAPTDPDVPNELGLILLRNGDAAGALAAFGKALALAPGDAKTINNRGAALYQLGQKEAARQDFQRALEKNRCLTDARSNLAMAGGSAPPAGDCPK